MNSEPIKVDKYRVQQCEPNGIGMPSPFGTKTKEKISNIIGSFISQRMNSNEAMVICSSPFKCDDTLVSRTVSMEFTQHTFDLGLPPELTIAIIKSYIDNLRVIQVNQPEAICYHRNLPQYYESIKKFNNIKPETQKILSLQPVIVNNKDDYRYWLGICPECGQVFVYIDRRSRS